MPFKGYKTHTFGMSLPVYFEHLLERTMTCSLNLDIWDDPHMQRIQALHNDDGFITTCSTDLVKDIITDRAYEMKTKILAELKNRRVHVTLDVTTQDKRSVLGVAVHFLKDWNSVTRYLGLVQIPPEATVEALQFYLEKCLQEYGVEMRNVFSVTTDSDVNCWKKRDMLTDEVLRIASTGVHPVADQLKDAVGKPEDVLEPAQVPVMKVVEKVAASYNLGVTQRPNNEALTTMPEFLARDERGKYLKTIKDILMPEQKDKMAKWRSYLKMGEVIHSNRDHYKDRPIDWARSAKIYWVANEMDYCSRVFALSGANSGDLMVQILSSTDKLRHLAQQTEYAVEANDLANILEKKGHDLFLNIQFAAAVYLDPRFVSNKTTYFPPLRTELIKNYLLKLRTRMFGGQAKPSFDKAFLNLFEREGPEGHDDFLEYWRKQKVLDDEFQAVAEVVLAYPACQGTAEAIFDAFPHVHPRKKRPLGRIIHEYAFVKLNCYPKQITEFSVTVAV